LDEFDAYIERLAEDSPTMAADFLAEINTLMQGVGKSSNNAPKMFGCIFAANHTLAKIVVSNGIPARGSGLIVENVELEWFDKEQIHNLALHYLPDNPTLFTPDDINLCFDMTHGYPYFVQKFLSIMYDQKATTSNDKKYSSSQVKDEYGKTFNATVGGWGQINTPVRTREKLNTLTKDILKSIGNRN